MIAICCSFEDRNWVQRQQKAIQTPKAAVTEVWRSSECLCNPVTILSPDDNQPRGPVQTFMHWTVWSRVVVPPRAAQKFQVPKGSFSVLSDCPFAAEKSWVSDAHLRQLQILWHTAGWLLSAVWIPEHRGLVDSSWHTCKSLAEHCSALAEETEIKHQTWKCRWHWCSGTWTIRDIYRRPRKYYTVPCKSNIKWNFCLCSWCGLYSFHSASSWEYFNAKKNIYFVLLKDLTLAISMKLQESHSQGITSWTQHSSDCCDTHAKVILV